MYEFFERGMTEEERERLFGCMPISPSPFRPFRNYEYGLQVIGETFGVLVLASVFIGIGKWPAIYVIPALLGLLATWWVIHLNVRILRPLRMWRSANEEVWKFRNAVAAARTVYVHSVQSDLVVQVTYDEGTICLFEVGESETYWIDPYCILPGCPPKEWPNRKFEVVKVPGWKDEVGPFCYGKRLRAREAVELRGLFDHNDFLPPADGVIHQSINTFLRDAKARNRSVTEG